MSISLSNLTDYLYKKAIGVPETNTTRAPSAEQAYFSKQNVFSFQNLAQNFPATYPNDFVETSIPGDVVVSNVFQSRSYPYIKKYVHLTTIPAYSGSSNSFYSPYLKNYISPSLSPNSEYNYSIFTNDTASNITTNGTYGPAHIMDSDSGVLTFFTYPSYGGPSAVTDVQPPKITFFRYEGLVGNVGIASIQEF